jgi:hypothetical protein
MKNKIRDSKQPQYSLIHIENCQVKSLKKARRIAKLLDRLEKEIGIREVEISFKNTFICPDIDLNILRDSSKPMESILGKIFILLHNQEYGKKSKYKEVK